MPLFKRGDRIIRVGGSLPRINRRDKVIAGTVSDNGRLVIVNGVCLRTCFFKKLIRCKGQ